MKKILFIGGYGHLTEINVSPGYKTWNLATRQSPALLSFDVTAGQEARVESYERLRFMNKDTQQPVEYFVLKGMERFRALELINTIEKDRVEIHNLICQAQLDKKQAHEDWCRVWDNFLKSNQKQWKYFESGKVFWRILRPFKFLSQKLRTACDEWENLGLPS